MTILNYTKKLTQKAEASFFPNDNHILLAEMTSLFCRRTFYLSSLDWEEPHDPAVQKKKSKPERKKNDKTVGGWKEEAQWSIHMFLKHCIFIR